MRYRPAGSRPGCLRTTEQTTAAASRKSSSRRRSAKRACRSVPISIQAIGTERLEQLQVKDFTDYVKFLPSVSFTSLGPGFSLPYFRGVASGENNNHSGPSPSVGMYLDEQPITTIQGALDIHMYDIARVEALAGPQGTLYGASSQAGTIRIITNKPDPSGFAAGYGLEGNYRQRGRHGLSGRGLRQPADYRHAAVRLVGWVRHDAGYIDNVAGERTYTSTGACITNVQSPSGLRVHAAASREDLQRRRHLRRARRAASRTERQLDHHADAHGPEPGSQRQFRLRPRSRRTRADRTSYPTISEDKWVQAALTVEGKIGNFDLVYAGAYLKRDDIVDADYSDYTFTTTTAASYVPSCLLGRQHRRRRCRIPRSSFTAPTAISGRATNCALSSPNDNRFRFVAGLFYQDQEHEIFQNYQINGLGGYSGRRLLPDRGARLAGHDLAHQPAARGHGFGGLRRDFVRLHREADGDSGHPLLRDRELDLRFLRLHDRELQFELWRGQVRRTIRSRRSNTTARRARTSTTRSTTTVTCRSST